MTISVCAGRDISYQPKAGLSTNTVSCGIDFDSGSAAYSAVMHSACTYSHEVLFVSVNKCFFPI